MQFASTTWEEINSWRNLTNTSTNEQLVLYNFINSFFFQYFFFLFNFFLPFRFYFQHFEFHCSLIHFPSFSHFARKFLSFFFLIQILHYYARFISLFSLITFHPFFFPILFIFIFFLLPIQSSFFLFFLIQNPLLF